MQVREVSDLLVEWALTLAVAESCTGGLMGKVMTDEPGSSRFFKGGIVAYSNEIKGSILGVEQELLDAYGAVSREVAQEMAAAVAALAGADIGVGVTGIAGPDGGSETKPVGLVYIAIVRGERVYSQELVIEGGRVEIRQGAVEGAVHLLWQVLMGKV